MCYLETLPMFLAPAELRGFFRKVRAKFERQEDRKQMSTRHFHQWAQERRLQQKAMCLWQCRLPERREPRAGLGGHVSSGADKLDAGVQVPGVDQVVRAEVRQQDPTVQDGGHVFSGWHAGHKNID